MARTNPFLYRLLCGYLCGTRLFEAGILCQHHSVGRRLCFCYGLHGTVADGQEKGGKLVLVDPNRFCFRSSLLCKRICVYECVLFYFTGTRRIRMAGVEEKGSPAGGRNIMPAMR